MCCIPYNFSWSIIYYVFFPCWTHVLPFYLTVTRTSLLLSCHSVSDRLEITPHMAHACCYDTQASNLDILDFLLSQKRSAWCSNFFFRRIRKFANTDYEPRHICQSVCPHGIDQLHFGRIFFKNFIFECCSKTLYLSVVQKLYIWVLLKNFLFQCCSKTLYLSVVKNFLFQCCSKTLYLSVVQKLYIWVLFKNFIFECCSKTLYLSVVQKLYIWVLFKNLYRKSEFHKKLARIPNTLHEEQHKFFSSLDQFLSEWEMTLT